MAKIEPTVLSPTGADLGKLDSDAVKATQRLASRGFEAYLVGGCVRDLLLDRAPKDFDIATSARPQQVKRTFPRNCRIIGRRFKLAHLHFDRNTKILEVSTFRRPPEADGSEDDLLITRDNEFGTAEEDALRRDFTINALFLDPTKDEILDWCDGLSDLEARVIRTIGDPAVRFREDPVRILRAAKFAGRLGFDVETETFEAMKETAGDLVRAAPPRVLEEILRLLRGGHAVSSFELLQDVGALESLVPVVADFLADADDEHRDGFWRLLGALDDRVASGYVPNNAVLLGVLHFGAVIARVEQENGRSPSSIAEELLGPLSQALKLPRRDAGCLKRICGVQHRFAAPEKKRRFRVGGFVRGPYFAEALELLALRVAAGSGNADELERWRDIADEHGIDLEEAVAPQPGRNSGKKRRARRRRDDDRRDDADRHDDADRRDDRDAPAGEDDAAGAESADAETASKKPRRKRRSKKSAQPSDDEIAAGSAGDDDAAEVTDDDAATDTPRRSAAKKTTRKKKAKASKKGAATKTSTPDDAVDVIFGGPAAGDAEPADTDLDDGDRDDTDRDDSDAGFEIDNDDHDGDTDFAAELDLGDAATDDGDPEDGDPDDGDADDRVADDDAATAGDDEDRPRKRRRRRRRRRRHEDDDEAVANTEESAAGDAGDDHDGEDDRREGDDDADDDSAAADADGDEPRRRRRRRRRGRRKGSDDDRETDAGSQAEDQTDASDPDGDDGPRRTRGKKAKRSRKKAREPEDKNGKKKRRDRRERRRGGRDVDVVPRSRDRRGKVEVIEPAPMDLTAFDVELDPKRVPTFGTIVEGKGRPKRRAPRVREDGVDDYKPPPPPGSGPSAPPPPDQGKPDDSDTFGDW